MYKRQTYHIVRDGNAIHLTLDRVRWVDDLAVSGTIDRPAAREGVVRATLRLSANDGTTGRVTVRWLEGSEAALARISGTVAHTKVLAQTLAP